MEELPFVLQLLQAMEIQVQLPITVHVDNVGAIWLANNNSSGERTSHMDIRAQFIKGFALNGVIDIVFVMSAVICSQRIFQVWHTNATVRNWYGLLRK